MAAATVSDCACCTSVQHATDREAKLICWQLDVCNSRKKRIRALSAAKCQHRLLHGHCNGNSSMQLCARNFPDYASLQCEIRQKYTRRWSKRYRLAAHSCQQLPLMQHRACNVRQLEIPNKFIHTALVMTLFYCCERQLAFFVAYAIVVVVIVG